MSGERDLSFLDSHFETAGIEPETGDDGGQQQQQTEQPTSPPPPPPPPPPQPTQRGDAPPVKRPTPEVGHARHDPQHTERPPLQYDARGNIVDAQGNVLAQAGMARRDYERLHNLQTDLVAANAKLHVLERIPQELGLSMPEVEFGIRAAKEYKTDPVATARWFVKQALARGGTLNQILGEHAQQLSGAPIQMDGIKSMIAEALQPLLTDRQAQHDQAALDRKVDQEYHDFISTHEHAAVHDPALGAMLIADPSLSPDGAYWRLRSFAIQNGYDFTQPLGPQFAARQATGASPQSQTTNGSTHASVPLPNGAGTSNAGTMQPRADQYGVEDTDSIIRNAMRDAGYTVQ